MFINLLPQKQKRELKEEEIWKRVFIILIFILIFIIFLILILYSLKLYIISKNESLKIVLEQKEEELNDPQFQNFKKLIIETNQELSKTQQFWQEQILVIPFFEKISALTPESIYFKSFSFQKISQETTFAQIHLSGWAEKREDLFYFREELKKEESFKEVGFLPSSWIEPTNVNFSLSFEYDFK